MVNQLKNLMYQMNQLKRVLLKTFQKEPEWESFMAFCSFLYLLSILNSVVSVSKPICDYPARAE